MLPRGGCARLPSSSGIYSAPSCKSLERLREEDVVTLTGVLKGLTIVPKTHECFEAGLFVASGGLTQHEQLPAGGKLCKVPLARLAVTVSPPFELDTGTMIDQEPADDPKDAPTAFRLAEKKYQLRRDPQLFNRHCLPAYLTAPRSPVCGESFTYSPLTGAGRGGGGGASRCSRTPQTCRQCWTSGTLPPGKGLAWLQRACAVQRWMQTSLACLPAQACTMLSCSFVSSSEKLST